MNAPDSPEAIPAARDLTRFITAVFGAWNSNGLPFLVLRNYEHLPESVSNDIDILVARETLALAERTLVTAARQTGYVLHNRAEFAPVSLFFHHPGTHQQVQVDLFASLEWRGLEILCPGTTLARRTQRQGFAVPDPADEAALNLLTRLLYHGYVKEKYREGIRTAVHASPDRVRSTLREPFGDTPAAFLVERVLAEQWSAIESAAPGLRRALLMRRLGRQPARVIRSMLCDARRLLRRALRAPGLSLVLLGPDGCGKSTVAPRIVEGLRHSFAPDKGLQIHWKPIVFFRARREGRPPTTEPHGRPPRGPVTSLLFLGYHWLEYLLGALLQVHRVKFRNGLVMIDRHYYDFLVDPRRYRLNAPAWAVRLGAALLPKPDLVFLLDAPASVLQSRKREVPMEETERQRQAFLQLVKPMPNGRVLDATQPPDQVADAIVGCVLDHMTERTQRHHPP